MIEPNTGIFKAKRSSAILFEGFFNKALIENIVAKIVKRINGQNFSKKQNQDISALDMWKKGLDNVTPLVEVRSRRVGGATFQIPSEIRPSRRQSIGMKNMILFARKRSGHSMRDRLAAEILAAFNEEGAAYKKKEDTHRMAEANKAFSHFRF